MAMQAQMFAVHVYAVRAKLADHRDYGHALIPWVRSRLDQRYARKAGQ